MEKRPNLFVVDGNEIVIPEPNEEQLLALAAERVGGNVTPQEFLEFPGVRLAMVQLFKKQELAKAKTLLAAEQAARRKVMEAALAQVMAELTSEEAAVVPRAPASVVAPECEMDKTTADRPVVPASVVEKVIRPPMPELGQGEVLSDYRALGIINDEKDPQKTNVAYRRFAKPEDLKRYQDPNNGNWWCMVTGRQVTEDLIRVVGAVLVCEKSHAERLAKKAVDPRGKEQHPYSIRGTLDWLKNKAEAVAKPIQPARKPNVAPASKKSPERLAEEEKIRAAVGEINSVDQLVSDGFRLLHLYQPDTWQFRCTQAMLSNFASGLVHEFEADLPDRFPSRGSMTELQKELDSVLEKRRGANGKSFESFIFHRLAGVLIRHREALQRPMSAPGSVGKKHRLNKTDKLVKHARSLGISPDGKTEDQLRSLIAAHERAKGARKGSKPLHGRRS